MPVQVIINPEDVRAIEHAAAVIGRLVAAELDTDAFGVPSLSMLAEDLELFLQRVKRAQLQDARVGTADAFRVLALENGRIL